MTSSFQMVKSGDNYILWGHFIKQNLPRKLPDNILITGYLNNYQKYTGTIHVAGFFDYGQYSVTKFYGNSRQFRDVIPFTRVWDSIAPPKRLFLFWPAPGPSKLDYGKKMAWDVNLSWIGSTSLTQHTIKEITAAPRFCRIRNSAYETQKNNFRQCCSIPGECWTGIQASLWPFPSHGTAITTLLWHSFARPKNSPS